MTTKGIMRRAGALLAPTVIALLLVVCQPEDDGGGGERASVATLNALTLSAGGATAVTLTPTPFDPETTGYSASVANSVESVTVTATTTDGGATLTIAETPTDSGVASGAIELTAGDDTQIAIVVTAEDAMTTATYTITVRRAPQNASSVATLNALTLSDGATPVALTPAFAGDTMGYSALVANTVASVTVTATATDDGATLTIAGASATSGTASGAIELTAGDDTQIDIVVTAEDAATRKTYTITVTRAPRDASSDATLSALTLSDGSTAVALIPASFDPATTGYGASVANTVASVTVTATTTDSDATLTIDGASVTSGTASGAIELTAGDDTQIDIVVTAEDAATRKTYTITVTRAPRDASSDATLSALKLSDGSTAVALIPASFDPATTGYGASVANTVASVTVTATTTDSDATLTIDGASVTSGTASGAIELTEGDDTQIAIVITAEDAATETYTITVTRAPRNASSDATLSALTLSDGATPVALSPAFAGDTTDYSASVGNTVESVTITAATTDDGATLTIDGASVTSGTASDAIALIVGATQIDIVVTAEDAMTTETYTIEVERDDGDGVADSLDVDDDNDGLIEINTLEDLDYVRHNLAGTSRKTSAGDSGASTRAGAPTASTDDCDTATDGVYLCGYELARSLDFAQSGSYAAGAVNSDWRPTGGDPATATNAGFVPIGDFDNRFVAIFEGNGFTIRNLYVNKNGSYAGLFGYTEGSAIARLGLPDATVRASGVTDGNQYVGALVGFNNGGSIELCHSTGLVSGSGNAVGGLVGDNFNTGATIVASYSSSAVSGDGAVGGLVGSTNDFSVITASHATGAVSGSGVNVGGLGGITDGIINASYATGDVQGSEGVGGLVGNNLSLIIRNSWASGAVMASTQNRGGLVGFAINSLTITNGYWDSETTGQTTSVGGGTGLPTAQMQAAGGSSFSAGFRDDCGSPFDFRSADEAARYPRLKLLTAGGDTSDCSDDDYHASELLGG